MNDIISAIATPRGVGGVSIVRISGDNLQEIGNKIFKCEQYSNVGEIPSHKMVYGKICNGDKTLDFGLLCYFKAPHSYTGDDTIELYCHGGEGVTSGVLKSTILNGARLATAGEFTRRAFVNGKLDLAQAEAVGDLIHSNTENATSLAVNQLDGDLSKSINAIREKLLDLTSHIMVNLDFSEEGVDPLDGVELINTLTDCQQNLDKMLSTADMGRFIRDGVNVAIVGMPNVGKSSLLNALTGEDTAIVTAIEGTTRDTIEISVNIQGVKVNLVDTAGIRQTDDIVESMGVDRAKAAIERADLVLAVLDCSRELLPQDMEILDLVSQKEVFYIGNKMDKKQVSFDFSPTFYICAKDKSGLDGLYNAIGRKFLYSDILDKKKIVITNERHKDAILRGSKLLCDIISQLENGAFADLILSDIENLLSILGEVVGLTVSEEIVDRIFAKFCVGK